MVLYMFWEITSISSFLLIAYWFERETRGTAHKVDADYRYRRILYAARFFDHVYATGTFQHSRNHRFSGTDRAPHPLFLPAILFILLGAFTKSAQFPFHIWLPDAMEAPTPISAYLHSATMVKAGIYLVARLTPVFGGTMEWFWIIQSSASSPCSGVRLSPIRQADLKAIARLFDGEPTGPDHVPFSASAPSRLHPDQRMNRPAVLQGLLWPPFSILFNHSMFKGMSVHGYRHP